MTGEKPRILIVETDVTVREMLREWSGKNGVIADDTGCPLSALSLVGCREYRFAAIGFSLRGMSGPELAGRIREAHPRLVIVGMSGLWWVDKEFYQAGARHFLCKPFDFKTLSWVLNAALTE